MPKLWLGRGSERLSLLTDAPKSEHLKVGIVDMDHSNDEYLMKVSKAFKDLEFITNASNISKATANPEVYWSSTGNFSKQMKKCETHGCQFILIFGPDEAAKETVQIKNLKTGEQQELSLKDLADFEFKY